MAWLALAALGSVGATVTSASAQVVPAVAATSAPAVDGRIEGSVLDEHGRPLAGVSISAEGAELHFATSDERGRFVLRALAPGTYTVAARRAGFVAPPRQTVVVRAAGPASYRAQLVRVANAKRDGDRRETPQLVTASLGGGLDDQAGVADVGAEPSASDPATETAPTALDEPTDHRGFAWRLRHQKRSVLREESERIVERDYEMERPGLDPSMLLGAFQSSARLAAAVFSALPLSGQVRFLTTSAFDTPSQLFSSDVNGAEGVAHVALASRSGEWTAQAAVMQGDVASWLAAGNYSLEPNDQHSMDVSVSYAAQRYNGVNPAILNTFADNGRNVGTIAVADHWAISQRVSVSSTMRYGRYDYLDAANLFSPGVSVGVSPFHATWVRATVSQQMTAPGAEEFQVTRAVDFWGPPQRTFSPAQGWDALRPERTRHVEIGLERELGSFVVGVKRVEQSVDDQILTVFGRVGAATALPDLRHYEVASVGQATMKGWSVVVSRPVGSRMTGTVEYANLEAQLSPSPNGAMLVSGLETGARQLHDVTGSLETSVPETRTRVSAVYKVNSGYLRPSGSSMTRGLDGRFDVRLHQGLPMPGAQTAEWELLVAVRNFFFDRVSATSSYNELLVVRPPKRVLGGVSVKF